MKILRVKNEQLKKLILRNREIVKRGKEIVEESEKLNKENNQLLLEMGRLRDKMKPIVEKLIPPENLGEFEYIATLNFLDKEDEIEIVIKDQVEEYKEILREKKKKEKND
jgi:hypothetical protein